MSLENQTLREKKSAIMQWLELTEPKKITVPNTKEDIGQEENDAIWKTVFQSLPNDLTITLLAIYLHYLKNLFLLQILLICLLGS